LDIFFNKVQIEFKTLFFNLLRKNIVLNYFDILRFKKVTKFKKLKFLVIKKKVKKIFKIKDIILNKKYLKSVLSFFNTKLKAFAYLLKQNHL
jgi:hypothetical protein